MMYPIISVYIEAIKYAEDNFATLADLRPVLDGDGNPVMSSGNFAVVFKMQDIKTNKLYALKCFTREQEGRAESYRLISDELEYVSSDYMVKVKYLDKELFVDTRSSDETEFPVVLMDWVEGITLDKWISRNIGSQYSLQLITHQFCRMASWLLSQPFAHGDLKPDNIIVTEQGSIVLVDYDGMYVPAMQGQKSRELGSPDYRHPLRTLDDFNEHIDDFSLAAIAMQLAAIALDPTLYTNHDGDTLLLTEQDHRDLANSGSHHQLLSLLHNPDFERLYALYHIAHAQQTLTNVDPRAFTYPKPDKSIISLSTKVNDEDLANGVEDEYGALYSPDGLRLLKGAKVASYAIRPGIKVICDKAFWGCNNLTSIIIPGSVTHIGDSAFVRCNNLTSIIIPGSVTHIGSKPFTNSGISQVTCHCYNFEADEYALYTKGKKQIISFFNKQTTVFTIPDSVTQIGDSAFLGCNNLTSIIIPGSVTHIGNNAFVWCNNLTSIIIPDSVTHIGDWAFFDCRSLTSITIPDSVMHIGSNAFWPCFSLTSIFIPRGSKDKFKKLLPSTLHGKLVEQ